MISARRAASLGLWVPLSAIMSAVLGLWPEPEEDEPTLPQVYGSGRKRWRDKSWPAIVWRARPGSTSTRSRPVDDEALADKVRRAWDEIDALRGQAPAVDGPGVAAVAPAPAPAPESAPVVAPFALVVAGVPQTLSFSAPQPPDAWPETRIVSDDDALIALMVAELA